jgi:hypothetical protein
VRATFNDGWRGVSYQWYRGDTPIKGATGAHYLPTKADLGHTLTVRAVGQSTTGVKDNSGTGATRTDRLTSSGLKVVRH